MSIKDFLTKLETQDTCLPVTCFTGKFFCASFLSTLVSHFAQTYQLDLTTIDAETITESELSAHLSMQGFGRRKLVWCGDLDAYSDSVSHLIKEMSVEYTGPACLVFFATTAPKGVKSVVSLDEEIDSTLFRTLLATVYDVSLPTSFELPSLHAGVGVREATLTFDDAMMLAQYAVLGEMSWRSVSQARWFERLAENNRSLFTLTQYFFAKQSAQFVTFWRQVSEQYPPEFWTVFWMDVIWQAWGHLVRMQQRAETTDRKLSSKLPFSFVQRDWKRFKSQDFVRLHHKLYSVDFALKNGLGTYGLDLALISFVYA